MIAPGAVGAMGRPAVRRYAGALLAVIGAVLVRSFLSAQFGQKYPFFFFLFALVFAAAYGGRGPGLAATALSTILGALNLAEPRLSVVPNNGRDLTRIVFFAVLGSVITLIVDRFQRANERLRRTALALEQANARLRQSEDNLAKAIEQLRGSQAQITHANQRLRQSNEDLQTFAYSVSHDLQTPLRTVGAFCQLLSRKYRGRLDGEADDLFDHIDGGVRRMSALVSDLLQYSKVTHVDAESLTETDCNQVLNGVLKDFEAAIREASAEVVIPEPLPTVKADPQRISQVFMNLIGNALKYRSERPPRIVVSAKTEDKRYVFSVQDNGIGFEMDYAERIFKAFERLHSGSKYEGTGIGLAIVQRIVERHGGRVWAESKSGGGATFHFTLPCEAAPRGLH
ncbi:MAG: ATP-binding protein [Bryobacteraceae bacterium]